MSLVTVETVGDVAVLSIDNPPVNAGNSAQRSALFDAIAVLGARTDVSAIVITTAGRHFYAGSDLREFDLPLSEPQLPAVISALDGLTIPVVAAVRGLVLGGGLELALGCDARISTPTTELGFPEVGFGIVPGAGGTVRSARLIGVESAADLVTTGRRIGAAEAEKIGLVDAVVPDSELLERAVAWAAGLRSRRRLVDVPSSAPFADRAGVTAGLPRRHRPNVRIAAELVVDGIELSATDALAVERKTFDDLRITDESNSLRYLFFARQAAAKDLRGSSGPSRLERVGVIGAGTMGAGLAALFAEHGYRVVVVDGNTDALARITEDSITTSTLLDACAECDLVIEAVFEDMAVKQDLLQNLEKTVRDDAVLASNTSYLDLDEMAERMLHPNRFAGLHFFNPARRNPLVEVIPAAKTDERTRSALGSLASAMGKVAIVSGVGDGFVGNRVYADYRAQAEILVEDGATPAQVDQAMGEFGMAVGPFAVADMSGLDIAWSRRKRLAPDRDPDCRYVHIADRLCEAGRLGKKVGAGWYAYPDGAGRGIDDPAVNAIIDECRAAAGSTPRAIDADEIRMRILGAMVAGAAAVLASGVARRASDVDVALTEGFAFPRHRGGPVKAFSRLNESEQVRALAAVHSSDPHGYPILAESGDGVVPSAVRRLLDEATR
ncbi:3-hydroxyacyl-CoA dehydrogenase NAD-binding domain-containing protein [Rhodococcoides yunnanense]|uniref:3-hydroxyacyl-CoA dehydrogenase NAD-binding domain-containing protein n=1 Tax=Rhodococcoides yunnanense TaxID=278209 RepID=UPI000932B62A|nr:3-hydroxyacyl-CoA dehydrogenase NAD-binding domain-containing protein [Rhodococcus yunnanensis]